MKKYLLLALLFWLPISTFAQCLPAKQGFPSIESDQFEPDTIVMKNPKDIFFRDQWTVITSKKEQYVRSNWNKPAFRIRALVRDYPERCATDVLHWQCRPTTINDQSGLVNKFRSAIANNGGKVFNRAAICQPDKDNAYFFRYYYYKNQFSTKEFVPTVMAEGRPNEIWWILGRNGSIYILF